MFAKPRNFQKNLAVSNNAKVRSFEKNEANFDPIDRVYNYPIDNHFKASFTDGLLQWSMVKQTQNGGYLTNHYKDVLAVVLGYYNNDLKAELPVLAVITDSFPHEMSNFGNKARKTVGGDVLPRDLAYYGWDERTNCIELWLNRYYKVANFEKDVHDEVRAINDQLELYKQRSELPAGEVQEQNANHTRDHQTLSRLKERLTLLQKDERFVAFSRERQFIEQKLLDFTKPVSEDFHFINRDFELFRLAVNRPDKKSYILEFSFKDGRVITFDTLPMGYKRIFSMVIDIAYRSYILNEGLESHGIVLIDEVELHLHPTLQQDILQRLKRTFPNIQFIITTHSPLVISNFRADQHNIVIKLNNEGNEYSNRSIGNVYGVDYNTGLTEVMGASYREAELDKLIDSIVILKKFNKTDQAEKLQAELLSIVGEDNAYILEEIENRLAQNAQ
ncbi:hypothetical protein GCM10023313_12040 [Mucilaginibacter defluvii]|uniref:ATPase AAA-type core domain-containing protein n=2 Tax=Mucilaginibacter defluvii TaxID=1196019 RepID=A0ABP9FNN8_9SPHI